MPVLNLHSRGSHFKCVILGNVSSLCLGVYNMSSGFDLTIWIIRESNVKYDETLIKYAFTNLYEIFV